ncbi:MAG: hypothetical protein ABI887_08995 [Burkholderiales bacterium]
MSKQADLNPVRVELSNGPVCKVSLGGMRSPYLARTQAPAVQVQLRAAPACKVSLGGMRSPYLARTQRG